MPVSVTMPQLGESVSEGTVTRWLKKEGEYVDADEPLLEISTEKVDAEVPSPASGTLQSVSVSEDETVEVGAELGLIAEGSEAGTTGESTRPQAPAEGRPEAAASQQAAPPEQRTAPEESSATQQPAAAPTASTSPQPAPAQQAPAQQAPNQQAPNQQAPNQQAAAQQAPTEQQPAQAEQAEQAATPAAQEQAPEQPAQEAPEQPAPDTTTSETPYVTPLVRKLAAEHGVDLRTVEGTGVGGRIRKQDVLDAARSREAPPSTPPTPGSTAQRQATAPQEPAAPLARAAPAPEATTAPSAPEAPTAAPTPEAAQLRGRTERMSRTRSVIARRMTESLQVSAQLTTVVEVDVTRIARLRDRAKADFAAREGVKLSFLPFFAQATVEALKAHPKLNAGIDTEKGEITYYDAEHLGIAVDTERGLLVPVIHDAGDLNLGGLARKIVDLADRTRAAKVSVDELGGGTFTLTNIGSRGAVTDTPIINQPQVGILGTGKVVKRPVVIDDPELGEVFVARSMAYFPLTYDHRLVDGADAARFLDTVKTRLEEGNFEAELGLA